MYKRSNDFPNPLPSFNASEMKNKARTDSSNSMNYPQPLLPGQEKELGQKKVDKGPRDGPESDYEFVKENKFKRYHLSGEKSAWSDEDRQILTKNLKNSYNSFYNGFLLIEQQNDFGKIKENYGVINDFLGTNFVEEEVDLQKPSKKDMEKFILNQEKKIFSFNMSILSF